MAVFLISKNLITPAVIGIFFTLTACQATQKSAISPATPLPKAIVTIPKTVLPQVLPKVITPKVVETIIKDPTPPKAVINGNIAPEIENITPEYLANYHWKLVKATDSNNKEILPLMDKSIKPKLEFYNNHARTEQHSLGFTVSCNQANAVYSLVDNVLITSNIAVTMMGCPPLLNEAETQLAGLFHGTSQLSMRQGDIPFLTQITEKNTTLVWQGTQTARSRYAQEPETVFLAVSPDTAFCDDKTTRQCLQIKPVIYVDNKKVVTGDWLLLDGTIEGYTHNPDEAQVIRVERYTVVADNTITPSKPKHYVYVFDQVIESAVVNK